MQYQFQEIRERAEKAGKCPGCGKVTRRSKAFSQTVNPFNRNTDGDVKTPTEVRADVSAEAAEWVPDFWHASCKPEVA